MTFKSHYGRLLSFAALAATLVAAVAGCGGGSTNGDAFGATPSSYPYIYAYGDNVTGVPASGLGTGSAANPAATDTFLFTFASANSNPTATLSGAGPFVTGLSPIAAGTVFAAAAPGGTYIFRAQGAQGQVGHTPENITTATITPPGGAAEAFTFGLNTDPSKGTIAAGPFNASPYVASMTIPASAANTVVTIPTTITDAAGHSTTTTFESVILSPSDAAFASASSLSIPGVTPIATYGPDASGTTVIIVPTGSYTPSVGGTPVTAAVTAAAGTVTVE